MTSRTGILICLVLALIARAAGETSPRWLPLAEVLKKYEGQSLEVVQQAAGKGEATACHYLGYAYAEGLRGTTNAQQAIAWYGRGIELGYMPSAGNLGLLYSRGTIVPRDEEKALRYCRLAAEGGVPNAQVRLAFFYDQGAGVKRDPGEAVKWYRLAADASHAQAMVGLGRHYRFGEGVGKDLREAIKWFRLAAEKGDPEGTLNLGWVYGYEQNDLAAATECFREAAKRGLSEGMVELYLTYRDGKGVAKNPGEAKNWLTQAAEAGLAKAQYWLGDLNDLDTTTWRENPVEAIRWYRLAAEQNWPGAQLRLAEHYLGGKTLEQDEERALELMRAAADQNYAPALRELAGLYARGIGEPRRREDEPLQLLKRVTQLQKPGERSESQWAYEEIAQRYQCGLGTEKDLVSAAQWYCRGAQAGVWFFSLEDKAEDRPRLPRGETMTSTPDLRGVISLILPERESDETLQFLFAHQLQDRYRYLHRWQTGDVLMWDDLSTIHQAVADYGPDEPRLIKRCQVMATRFFGEQ